MLATHNKPPQTFAQHKYVPSLLPCTNHRKQEELITQASAKQFRMKKNVAGSK
jgi:hypothetical protein